MTGIINKTDDIKGVDAFHALQLALDIDAIVKIFGDKYEFYLLTGELYEIGDGVMSTYLNSPLI